MKNKVKEIYGSSQKPQCKMQLLLKENCNFTLKHLLKRIQKKRSTITKKKIEEKKIIPLLLESDHNKRKKI